MLPQMPKQRLINFGPNYKLSIVDEQNHNNKYELAVFFKERIVEMRGITDTGDTVTRFRTAKDVEMIMKKMFSITGKMPKKG